MRGETRLDGAMFEWLLCAQLISAQARLALACAPDL